MSKYQWIKRCEIIPQFPVLKNDLLKALPANLRSREDISIIQIPYYLMASSHATTPTPQELQKVLWDPCLQLGQFESYSLEGNILGVLDIHCLPGVTDNPGRSLKNAFQLFDIDCECFSGQLYIIRSRNKVDMTLDENSLKELSLKVHNPLIEASLFYGLDDFTSNTRFETIKLPEVNIHHDVSSKSISLDLNDTELEELSRFRRINDLT